MIRARTGFLCHTHSALLSHAGKPWLPLSAPRLSSQSSFKIVELSRGFRGFLCIYDRQNHFCECHSSHGCSRTSSKQRSILSLWRFDGKYAISDYASCQTSRGLHTSTGQTLTTSELIKRLQVAKTSISKTSTPNAVLTNSDLSVSGSSVNGNTNRAVKISPTPDNLEKESMSDRNAVKKKPLSKLIPQHTVDMGFEKKESFSKNQDRQRGYGEAQGNRQRHSNQWQQIPVLRSESLRDEKIHVSLKSSASAGVKLGNQQKMGPQLVSRVSSSRGKRDVSSGSANRSGLLAAAFDSIPSSIVVSGLDQTAAHVPQHEESADISGKDFSVRTEASRKSTQYRCEIKESCQAAGTPYFQDKIQARRQFQPIKTTERSAKSRQLEQEGCTETDRDRFQARTGAISPSPRFQQEIESKSSESFAKQRLVHENDEEWTIKQRAISQKEVSVQFSSSSVLLENQTSESAFITDNYLTNTQHTEEENVAAFKHIEEGRSSLQSQCKRMSMFSDKQNSLISNQEQCQLFGEHSTSVASQVSHGSEATDGNAALYRSSRDSAGENGETNGMQSFSSEKSARVSSQIQLELVGGVKPQDTATGGISISRRLSQSALGDLMSDDSRKAALGKAVDRNRPRKRKKNELKEKDLSVQPVCGEQHYEYLIRRKQVRAEAQKALVDDVDDYKHVGDDWVKKRLGWLCKEIPVLKASGVVKMLNNQRKWIKQEHLKDLIEHLVRYMELKRAHRVLKWMQQQPFYKFEYELHNNMAFILGRNDKLSRCQDVFDEIVRNGRFPDASVFTALIKAYLNKGDQGDINDAWKIYNQMLQLGLTIGENLSETLLKSLTCPTGRWIRQAEELFVKMKSSGIYINEEMYSEVIALYGKRGDHKKIDAMLNELDNKHLKPTLDILNAKLEACVQDGDTVRAEATLREIVETGYMPNWRSYSSLIQVYGKANLPMQSWQVFEKMKGINMPINFVTYHSIIEALAANGENEKIVMQVLTEVEESGIKPLQPCYNSVMNMYLGLKEYEKVECIFNRGKAAKVSPGHAAFNMLMKAYTESGKLDEAEALFQEMKKTEGMGPNTHTYNILLSGYGVACFKARARELFEEMSAKGCQLDHDVRERVESLISVKKIAELEKKRLKLTNEQREIIPGLLLGGATMISPDRNRTYELHLEFNCENEVKRAIKNRLSFLFQAWWKPNQSGQSAEAGVSEVSAEEDHALKSFVRLETVNHGSLRFYAHQYRPEGIPIIPRLIHRWLKPRTLAYWYMYGGRKCQKTGGIILNASKYSGKQIQLVAKALKARTMDCRRRKRRNGDVIRFEGKSATWLWKLMEPYILKTVKEQLKPEEIPIDLALAEGATTWESQHQFSNNAEDLSSDEDDWEELEAEATEILED